MIFHTVVGVECGLDVIHPNPFSVQMITKRCDIVPTPKVEGMFTVFTRADAEGGGDVTIQEL